MTGPSAAFPVCFTHPTRRPRPAGTELHKIYRDMVLFDFQAEIHAGFFVSYYRNFAVPSIARTLAGTGEMAARPLKRSYDTGIVIHEIIANGFDHERSRAMIGLLCRVHAGVPGTAEDFVYVLMTLLVLPLRWVEAHGWRRLTALEKEAATAFYSELGRRMGLGPGPGDLRGRLPIPGRLRGPEPGPEPGGGSPPGRHGPCTGKPAPGPAPPPYSARPGPHDGQARGGRCPRAEAGAGGLEARIHCCAACTRRNGPDPAAADEPVLCPGYCQHCRVPGRVHPRPDRARPDRASGQPNSRRSGTRFRAGFRGPLRRGRSGVSDRPGRLGLQPGRLGRSGRPRFQGPHG